MPDIFLRSGETNPNDIRLYNPLGGITAILTAETGAFALTGIAATLTTVLSGSTGTYSETGRSATLTAVLRPITGTYVLTGYAVTNPPGGEERQFMMLLGVR